MQERLQRKSIYDYGMLEDPRYDVPSRAREELLISDLLEPVARMSSDPLVYDHQDPFSQFNNARVWVPGVDAGALLENFTPIPPGEEYWMKLSLVTELEEDLIKKQQVPKIKLARSNLPDIRIDKPGRDRKSQNLAGAYRAMLLVANRTYGTVQEVKELYNAFTDNLYSKHGPKAELDVDAYEIFERFMDGELELDMRGFVVDLAFNFIEDVAYGVGGAANRAVQEILRVPPGAVTAWNQLQFIRERATGYDQLEKFRNEGMEIRIAKIIGDLLMGKVKSEADKKEIKRALRKIQKVWPDELFISP
jgi:hypothetical protein